jgi:hypothetical protein
VNLGDDVTQAESRHEKLDESIDDGKKNTGKQNTGQEPFEESGTI